MRIEVVVLLAVSGAITGGIAGLALGVLGLPAIGVGTATGIAVAAGLLDVIGVPTLAVRRQVPQYWGRIFEPRTVAVLYGARLGVGPLTILPTWLWWAAMVIGATIDPWVAAATGATFALVRTATMWAAGTRAGAISWADRPIRVGVAVVIAMAALAACSGEDEEATPTLTLKPTTTTVTIATPEDRALTDLLLDDALPGFSRADDAIGAGPMDLDAAAAAEVDPDAERALLVTRGFVRGESRAWLGAGDDVVYLAAYELGSAAQADAYLVDGTETLAARVAKPFDVQEVAGAVGFTTVEQEEGGDFVAHAVAFTRGSRWFLVLVGSSQGSRTEAEAALLAAAQAALVE